MSIKQLIINPGSTSTKLAVYEDKEEILQKTIVHQAEELAACGGLYEQLPLRLQEIRAFLAETGMEPRDFDNIMCRGGMVWGIGTGGYRVGDELADTLADEEYTSPHASALGGLLGKRLADEAGVNAYIYDAVTAASLPDIAKVTGFPELVRKSSCHVLNMHAMGEQYAADQGVDYGSQKLIIAHMGGGISFCAIDQGQIIDSIGDDDGPFSPERAGFTQILPIIKMCYSGKYSYDEMKAKVRGNGGLKAYLHTSDAREIERMIASGNKKAELLYRAQAYQIAKGIGELSIVHKGNCDAIILTGGLAYSKMLTEMVKIYVAFIAPIHVYPGEHEMEALAAGGLRIMTGQEQAKEFRLEDVAAAGVL
ncbi:butyrate kinase [Clostridiales bacterium]|nr:butyrate kinase [Clostridiales bacterium]